MGWCEPVSQMLQASILENILCSLPLLTTCVNISSVTQTLSTQTMIYWWEYKMNRHVVRGHVIVLQCQINIRQMSDQVDDRVGRTGTLPLPCLIKGLHHVGVLSEVGHADAGCYWCSAVHYWGDLKSSSMVPYNMRPGIMSVRLFTTWSGMVCPLDAIIHDGHLW